MRYALNGQAGHYDQPLDYTTAAVLLPSGHPRGCREPPAHQIDMAAQVIDQPIPQPNTVQPTPPNLPTAPAQMTPQAPAGAAQQQPAGAASAQGQLGGSPSPGAPATTAPRSVADAVARDNTRVNSVCPQYIETELLASLIAKELRERGVDRFTAAAGFTRANVLGRMCRPEEVADLRRLQHQRKAA